MRISYNKLWKLLIDKSMTKMQLKDAAGISAASIAKLGKGGNITTDVLLKICETLNCHIEDILENTGFGKLAAKRPGYRTSFNLVEEEEASDKEYGAAGAIEKLLIKKRPEEERFSDHFLILFCFLSISPDLHHQSLR